MTRLDELAPELMTLVEQHSREDAVPGVALAVGIGDEIFEHATGVLSLDTRIEATPDSVFQLGSITKTFTATLVMQLVDEGLVDLDEPVRAYVPEFSLADQAAAATVTVRQVLCHTGGFEGDVFGVLGRGEDALARYVEALVDRGQVHPPGRFFSYCNSGYSVLGRLVECVSGLPSWDAALRKRLIEPLGLGRTVSLAEEAIMFRTAVGHVEEDGDGAGQRVVSEWQAPRSENPMGAAMCASASDLITWARFHLRGGVAADGTRLLSAASAAAMREAQVVLPGLGEDFPRRSWGLGWALTDFGGGTVFGHDGCTTGQTTRLVVAPQAGVACAVLTNGGAPMRLLNAVRNRVLGRLAGIDVPPPPTRPNPAIVVDPRRFVGRYQTADAYYEIGQDADGGFVARWGVLDPAEQVDARPVTFRMTGYSPSVLISTGPPEDLPRRLAFPETGPDGRAAFVFDGSRVALRLR